ncbi:uncharacterized protein CBL_04338 [Carabus blaptoides fortunei]
MNQYKVKGHIGEGAHGYVMKAINLITNQEVAIKKLSLKSLNEGIPNNVLREIKVLQQIDCEYVVQLIDVIPHGMGFVVIMEYIPFNLADVIRNLCKPLSESQIKKYMRMLLMGVAYLHGQNIMHRDLKPSNLLISQKGTLKIADLGLARLYSLNESDRQYSHQVATRWYRAPELLYGSRSYTPSVDMWAVGCIFGEMINKSPLFPGETDIEQLAIILRTLGTPTEEIWPGLTSLPDYNKISFPDYTAVPWDHILPDTESHVIDFIRHFIQYNRQKRKTAREALINQYFFIKPLECDLSEMPQPDEFEENNYSYNNELNFDDLVSLFTGS